MNTESRRHIRHTSDVPIEVRLDALVQLQKEYLINISLGGVCFKSAVSVREGTVIAISIPLVHPRFQSRGRVVWCQRNADYFDVGVEFMMEDGDLRKMIVEKVCHIQNYKDEVYAREGRRITGEEAAVEWLSRAFDDKVAGGAKQKTPD